MNHDQRTRHRLMLAVLASGVLLLVSGCQSQPTTKAALCGKFDALGKEVLATHILSDNAVFRRLGSLADAADHYEASPAVQTSAPRLHQLAKGDSLSSLDLINATSPIASVCGHPLGIG